MRISRRSLWLLVGIILAALVARLYRIQAQSIWFDEGWSAYAAVQPTLRAAVEADATNPPLYYLLLNIAVHGMGDSPLALRGFSTMIGVLVIPLAYRLARRLFDERAGLAAAFLAAFSPLLWWASQEARMYTLLAVLLLMTALAWHRLLYRPARWRWLALWGGELALLYAHNTGPAAVLWLNLVTILVWVIRRSPKRPDWRAWIAGQIGVAVLWSPWLVTRFVLLQAANSAVTRPPQLGFPLLSKMWQSLWTGPWPMVDREPLVVILSAAVFVMAMLLIPWRLPAARWLLVHVVILTSAVLVGLAAIGNEMHGRYLVMVAPLLLVAIGAGIARYRLAGLAALALIAVTFVASVYFAAGNPAYAHDDARGMVQYYADHLTSGDTVLAWSYADRYDLAYYWDRLGVDARRVTLPEGADLDAIVPLLPASGDVALNVWYTQRADYRGMMPCILSHGTVNEPEIFTVYGMSDQLYRSPSLSLPRMRPFEAVFSDDRGPVAEVTAVGDFPHFAANQALCLPVQMVLPRSLNVDLKATVLVLNDLGWEVARADAVFATANQRTTSQLAPGDTLTAFPVLWLPYGAPLGQYTLKLRLYDEQAQMSGYDVASEGGKEALLGTWTVLPGADWSSVNRSPELPVTVNLPVTDHLVLAAHNAEARTLVNGDILRLAFLWRGTDALPGMALAAADGSWQVDVPARIIGQHSPITLDWRAVQIPPDAGAGTAELRLPDGTVIARYPVEALPAQYTEPDYATPVGVEFPGVGTLVGYTLDGDTFDRSQPIPLTLVWRASGASAISYTVFVQLLDVNGKLIAQSDAVPAQGTRPTTGWRAGEYIVDTHQVVFHEDALPGTATLIVGLYDAATGERILLSPGWNAYPLVEGLTIR